MKRTKLLAGLLGLVLMGAPGAFAEVDLNDQLPDPDGKPADMTKPVKVFIIMGQSNTLEYGILDANPPKEGASDKEIKKYEDAKSKALRPAIEEGLYPFMVDEDGNWTVRQDVRQVHVMQGRGVQRNTWLTVSGKKVGIDQGIGHQLGTYFDEPVMVLRSSIGNRGLGWDLLPPGSPSWERVEYQDVEQIEKKSKALEKKQEQVREIKAKAKAEGKEPNPKQIAIREIDAFRGYKDLDPDNMTLVQLYDAKFDKVDHPETGKPAYKVIYTHAGYKQSPSSWYKGSEPQEIGWYAGKQYDDDTTNALNLLKDLQTYYPEATGFEVAGFFWWQGCKDRGNPAYFNRYELHLEKLLVELRKTFNSPDAKMVAASLGEDEMGVDNGGGKILEAIMNLADPAKHPDLKGDFGGVYSYPLAIPPGGSCGHYGGSARTYMNVGLAMGTKMVDLFKAEQDQ